MIKKVWIVLLFCGWAFIANAQTRQSEKSSPGTKVCVEKSVFSIQAGPIGVWVNNEFRLSHSFVLRTELGYSAQLLWGTGQEEGFLMTPVFTIEPRWYYNFQKRKSKAKRIDGNSGNYLSLQSDFYPTWGMFSTFGHPVINPVLALIPMWGMRRNISRHFNYELGVGLGYVHYFPDKYGYGEQNDLVLNLFLRIGYRF